jgi:hypothetical protein
MIAEIGDIPGGATSEEDANKGREVQYYSSRLVNVGVRNELIPNYALWNLR